MTAVEYFFNELQRMQYFIGNDMLEAYKQAKQLEKQQIIDAVNQKQFDDIDGLGISDTITKGEQYYTSTYGSKGSEHIEHNLEEIISKAHTKITRTKGKEYAPTSNEIQKEIDDTSSQTEHDSPKVQNKDSFGEISDEEMDKAAINFCIKNIDEEVMHWHDIFVSGAKWYREQLKKKL